MQQISTSTGSKTSGGQTVSIECTLTHVQLISDGTNAATLQVYDGTSSSGVLLASLSIAATTAAPQSFTYNKPVVANKGLFTVLTGTGASFLMHYIPGT